MVKRMARLIDADALKETLSDLDCEANNADFQSGMEFVMCDFMPKVIDAQPTIETEPVRHGRWIFVGEETMHDGWTYRKHKCTECGFVTVEAKNFCPHCGAKMDGGAENG